MQGLLDFILQWQGWLFTAGHLLTGIVAGGHALLKKAEPRAAQLWLIICLFIPYVGPFAYFLFGINRIEMRARRLLEPSRRENPIAARYEDGVLNRFAPVGDTVIGRPCVAGNAVRTLVNGEAAYPAMLAAIDRARSSVYMSSYIFSNDHIGRRFVDALAGAQRRGVAVRVLVDAIGEWYSFPRIKGEFNRAKIPYRRYLPPRWFPPFGYVNLRNHRKLLLIDGATGFTGGMNIGARHVVDVFGVRKADDVHFQLDGPVVHELCNVFAEDWQFAGGDELKIKRPEARHGGQWCRVVPDGPNEDVEKLSMTIQGAVANAEKSVVIMTPYFLPPRELLVGLQTAAVRGVDVRVVIPKRSNLPYVDWATQHLLHQLTRRGVRIYQRNKFSHAKLFVADDEYALIGTANMDPRSLRLNFELGVEVFDAQFASELSRQVVEEVDTLVTTEALTSRPLAVRLRDAAFALASPYL